MMEITWQRLPGTLRKRSFGMQQRITTGDPWVATNFLLTGKAKGRFRRLHKFAQNLAIRNMRTKIVFWRPDSGLQSEKPRARYEWLAYLLVEEE